MLASCKSNDAVRPAAHAPVVSAAAKAAAQMPDEDTPPPEKTGGFDGKRAFADVAKQVDFGPRPSGSQAIAQVQDYILVGVVQLRLHHRKSMPLPRRLPPARSR